MFQGTSTLHRHTKVTSETYLQSYYVMSFIASLRKIPKWQLGVTGGLLFWAAALQVCAAATLPCIQLIICMRWTLCRSVVNIHTKPLGSQHAGQAVSMIAEHFRHETLWRVSTVAHPHHQAGVRGEVLGPASARASRGGSSAAAQAARQQAVHLFQAAGWRRCIAAGVQTACPLPRRSAVHERRAPVLLRAAAHPPRCH